MGAQDYQQSSNYRSQDSNSDRLAQAFAEFLARTNQTSYAGQTPAQYAENIRKFGFGPAGGGFMDLMSGFAPVVAPFIPGLGETAGLWGSAAEAGAASAPIDWSTATAGGVADTGFGAYQVAQAEPMMSTIGGAAGEGGLGAASFGTGASIPTTTTIGTGFGAYGVPTATLGGTEVGLSAGLGSGLNQDGNKYGLQATPSQSYNLGSPVGTTTTPSAGGGIASPSGATGAGSSAWDDIKKGIQMVNTVSPVLGLGASIAGMNQVNQTADKLQSSLNSTYPYAQNFDLVDQYNRDPMSLLRNNPGYLASVDYAAKAQQRQNAAAGRNVSGYGDFLMADVLGKNAEQWWKDAWQPIRDSAGLTNPGAQLNAQTNAINSINQTKQKSLADMWNQGTKVATQTLPEIFKWLS